MFGGELSGEAQAVIAQMPLSFGGEGRRVLLHPLPLFNNSVGAQDMMQGAKGLDELLGVAGDSIRALYLAGSLLPEH